MFINGNQNVHIPSNLPSLHFSEMQICVISDYDLRNDAGFEEFKELVLLGFY